MVFSSYNTTSYLPLDNDQSVTFYKNENRLFPTAIVPPRVLSLTPSTRGDGLPSSTASHNNSLSDMSNMSTTDMLTAAYEQQQQQQHHLNDHHRALIGSSDRVGSLITGDCPFGRVQSPAIPQQLQQQQQAVAQHQLHQQQQHHHHHHHNHRISGAVAMCDDFQPVAYLNGSSNGYYGYVPSLASNTTATTNTNTTASPSPQHNLQTTVNNNNHIGMESAGTDHRLQDAVTVLAHHHNTGYDDNERNNNNNVGPFVGGNFLSTQRKRKENGDFAMDTNHSAFDGVSDTKRRKTDQEEFPPAGPTEGFFYTGETVEGR